MTTGHMRKYGLWALGAMLLIAAALIMVPPSYSQGGDGEGDEPTLDHTPLISNYQGPQTCMMCHPADAQEVAQSVHYTHFVPALESEGAAGVDAVGDALALLADDCGLPAPIAAASWIALVQPSDDDLAPVGMGCARYHVGVGMVPNPVEAQTQADYQNVDCLLCHAPDYEREIMLDEESGSLVLAPAEGIDALAVAQSVTSPSSDMCLRCHAATVGAPGASHVDSFTAENDVHLAAGLECLDCHAVVEHQMVGSVPQAPMSEDAEDAEAGEDAQEAPPVTACTNCHAGHSGSSVAGLLDRHAESVACQSCHIPSVARDPEMPTVVYRDFNDPVLNAESGLFGPQTVLENDVVPGYYGWRDAETSAPDGDRGDGLLTPWRRITLNLPADSASDDLLWLDLGPYFVSGNLGVAVTQGAETHAEFVPGYEFSGRYELAEETLLVPVNHQVAPAESALMCVSCHNPEGRLDWEALGFEGDELQFLQNMTE